MNAKQIYFKLRRIRGVNRDALTKSVDVFIWSGRGSRIAVTRFIGHEASHYRVDGFFYDDNASYEISDENDEINQQAVELALAEIRKQGRKTRK